ncbi:hypothetical protein FRC17_005343 [Serendipita sp. 399]|nr:hypothetical protein FRC17_005343 [Serendipita sp. 399]
MAEMVASYPWEKTPLGPKDQWDPCLKQAVQLTLSSPYPTATWWGPDLVLIYNDAYAEMSTTKHPRIFGQKGLEAWDELWETLGPALKTCMEGNPVYKKDDLLLMSRLDNEEQPLEETYHSWSWTPILGVDQKFSGVFNGTHETSSKVIAERRMNTLQLLGNRSTVAQNHEAFCQAVLSSLSDNDKDVPFAALYFTETDAPLGESDESLITPHGPEIHHNQPAASNLTFKLSGSIGFSVDHPYLPPSVRVITHPFLSPSGPMAETELFSWPFQQAVSSREPIRVSIPPSVSEGIGRRGWGDRVTHAIVMTLSSDSDAKPLGVIILGLNTRRPFDADYSKWIDVLRSSLGSYMTGCISREEEVKRAENLSQLDAAKTALFSNASHELRTPLTLIAGPVTECLHEIKDPVLQKKLMMVSKNIDRLARLVDSLMDFSRLEAGRLEGRYSPVLFGPYVADLASVFKAVVEKAKLEYTITYDKNETRTVFIDQDYMEKIIFNLIGNAFKYTLAGSIEVEVVYSQSTVSLIVRDAGVGIPNADLPKIWDRFHRVEATSRSHEGTGIGLALTKQFVQLHGGTITVASKYPSESSDEHGSTFTATFPLGRNHLPAARLSDDSPFTSRQTYARGIVAEAAGWRLIGDAMTPSDSDESYTSDGHKSADLNFDPSDLIIVVDDNQDMLEYIKNIFGKYCHVRPAHNGQMGLDLARKYIPQLIISDVMMPVMDGFGLVNALKEDPLLRSIPIILLTARAADSNRAEGMMSGADDFVPKPFSSRELLARANLQVQLGKRRKEMEARFLERTKELQILSDLSPAGLFRLDNERNMVLCNDRFLELSGVSPGQESEWLNFVQDDYRDHVDTMLKQSLETRESGSVDFVFQNGTWIKCSVRWWKHGPVGMATDMTLTRLYEEALTKRAEDAEERRKEAEERRRGQELLVDVTSHELRQPVSAVINCANVVLGNLMQEIRQVCSILLNEMKNKGIKHSLAFGDSIQKLGVKYVSADKVRFGQIIINLLSNAIKFSQASVAKTIDIMVDVSRGPPQDESCKPPVDMNEDLVRVNDGEMVDIYVYMSVHDSGPGLQPRDLERLFQRFQRGTNSEEVFGGSGLGLFVSRKICDLLGGRIEVDESSVGQQGSTFRFFVCMSTAPPPLQIAPKAIDSQPATNIVLRVLIAEDNQINRKILSRQLKANNCTTVLAVNGAEAVDAVLQAGEETFDCILMDCEMPVMSGLEATKELRRLESFGQIPPQRIIALTGNARSEQVKNALDSGMDEVMSHVFNRDPLKDRTFKVTVLHERDLARYPEPLDDFLAAYSQNASSFGIAGSYVPCNSDTLRNYTACLLTKIAVASPEEVLVISLHYPSEDNPLDVVDHTVLYQRLFSDESQSPHRYVGCNVDRLALQLYGEYGFRIRNGIDVLSLGLDSLDTPRTVKRFAKIHKQTIDGGVLTQLLENENDTLEPDEEGKQDSLLASRAWFCAVLEQASEALAASLSSAVPVDVFKRNHEELMELKNAQLSSDRLRGAAADFQKHAIQVERGANGKINLISTQFNTRVRMTDFEIEVVFEHETVMAKLKKAKGKRAELILSESIDLKTAGEVQYARTMGKEEATILDNQRSNFILFALQGRVAVQGNQLLRQIWFPTTHKPSPVEPTLPELVGEEFKRLNRRQKRAVEEMMKEGPDPRIVLVHGPPGTGKTSVIAAMTQCLLNTVNDRSEDGEQEKLIQSAMRSDEEDMGKSAADGPTVWIVAQSNVAVKNVAEKLVKVGILDFKLIVSSDFHFEWWDADSMSLAGSSHHVGMSTFTPKSSTIYAYPRTFPKPDMNILTSPKLRNLDFYTWMPVTSVVVDEASQIQIGDLLPMLHYFEPDIKRVCFVGDHKQLAPYGQEEVQEIESIFEKGHIVGDAVLLNITYRLPQAICQSISSNVYKHELLAAHEDDRETCSKWIDVPGEEEEEGTSYINKLEAEAAILLAKQLEARGKDYRMISPYATQTELLLRRLKEENMNWEDKCFNVDSFQGNEADYIVITLVRTKAMGFLDNNRRANVLLTRCKKGMFVISNKALMLAPPKGSTEVLLQRYALEWTAQMQRLGRQWYTYQDLENEVDMIDPDLKPPRQSSQGTSPTIESKKTKRQNKRRK